MKYERPGFFKSVFHYIGNGFDKGEVGEWATEYALKNALPDNIYILRNLYIPYRNIETEIDLVMLHETGIYVIESKNYSGWIFGNDKHQYWTQCLKGGKKYKFYNPLFQNRTHINAIVSQLKLPPEQRPKSYIVFSERCKLKSVPRSTEDTVICKRQNLIHMIEKRIETTPPLYSQAVLQCLNAYLHQFEKY